MTTFISTQATAVYDPVAATGAASYAWLLILIPLASAGLLLLLGRASDKWGHLLATLASWSTFAGRRGDRRPDVECPRGRAPLRRDPVHLDSRR